MSGYDYGNARLRAMKSRLLSRAELESLAETGDSQALIAALSKTPYRQAVEMALVRTSGMDAVAEALHRDLITTLGRIRSFYGEHEQELVAVVLRPYDIHNLKTILRGVSQYAAPKEIIAALLPLGQLTEGILLELARAAGPREVIDLMAGMSLPMAQPLLNLRAEHPGAETPEMEIALMRWRFQEARQNLQMESDSVPILSAALDLEADLMNLLTVLRFADRRGEGEHAPKPSGKRDLPRLLVPAGRVQHDLLIRAAEENNLLAAIEKLAKTPYEAPLRTGLETYRRSGRLSDFERHLNRFHLHWMSQLIVRDPLGIGVLLGYLALKTNEVSNIRSIVQGIGLRLQPESIKLMLESVA